MASFRIQRIVHWLEMGLGKRIILTLALGAIIVLVAWIHCYKRFAGAQTEYTLEQAVLAKHLSEGKGFSTSVLYPQALVFLEERDKFEYKSDHPFPELYHAPFYALVLAGGLKLLPASLVEIIWQDPVLDSSGRHPAFNADYYLLYVNLLFFLLSGLLTYLLARRIFSNLVGILSVMGFFLSVALWDQVMSLSGVSILLFLFLLFFYLWSFIDGREVLEDDKKLYKSDLAYSFGMGLIAGMMFLTEYSSALAFPVFLGYLIFKYRSSRSLYAFMGLALAGFLLLVLPWAWRNFTLTGNPLALAAQGIALKVGDPTAEPETFKKSMSAEWPAVSFRKIGNKGLKGIEENLKTRIWSSGAYIFTAFFLVGCLYRFRNGRANRMRWNTFLVFILLLMVQPFFSSGESDRLPVFYLAPIIIIFGSGFFLVMLDSTGRHTTMAKSLFVVLLLVFQGIPMVHNLMEPRRNPFTFPPYWPWLIAKIRSDITDHFLPDYGLMADLPAGTAWYSQQAVWAQPPEYTDFVALFLRYNMGALYLSPAVLDKPYFSRLLRADLDIGDDFKKKRYWGAVYGGLQSKDIPKFFPLQDVYQINLNMYLLVNRNALPRR